MTCHLIHIGFHKTGSTYLQSWFARHPNILYQPWQIGGVQSVYQLIEQAMDGKSDQPRVTSCEDFSGPTRGRLGEWHAMGEAQMAVCCALHNMFPQAHILIVTRGFEAIIASAYGELVRRGHGETYDAFVRSPTVLATLPIGLDYDRLIAAYRTAFDGRVTVLPFELLRDDAAGFLRSIEQVLGVGSIAPSVDAENVRLSRAELLWHPRIARTVSGLPVGTVVGRKLATVHGMAIRSGWLRPLVHQLERWWPTVEQPPAAIPSELLRRLRAGAAELLQQPSHRPYADEYLGR